MYFHCQETRRVLNFNFFIGKTRNSDPKDFCKKDVLKNIAKFTEKHLSYRLFSNNVRGCHCVKNVHIPRYFSVSLRIQSECGKIRTRKTPNTDTFQAVFRPAILFEKDPQAQLLVSINFLKVINL